MNQTAHTHTPAAAPDAEFVTFGAVHGAGRMREGRTTPSPVLGFAERTPEVGHPVGLSVRQVP